MKLFAFLLLFFLTACGFTPVYAPGPQTGLVQANMSSIAIDTIPNREGQMVRNYLIDVLHKNGYPNSPQYRLAVSPIVENVVEIGLDKDDEASRAQLREKADIKLVNLENGKIIYERTVRSVSSYNILSGQFTTFVTRQDAQDQALRALAEQIVTDLELYFKQ